MVRERLSLALDQALGGEPVFIEREGVLYRLSVEPRKKARRRAPRYIQVLDPAIDAGRWTWDWKPGGMTFRSRRRRSR